MPLTSATTYPTLPSLTVVINTQERGDVDATCTDVVSYVAGQACEYGFQYVWNSIAVSNPTGFNTFVNTPYAGWFGSNDSKVGDSAFAGLQTCVMLFVDTTSAQAYADFDALIKAYYPNVTSADTGPAFDMAQQVLCVPMG